MNTRKLFIAVAVGLAVLVVVGLLLKRRSVEQQIPRQPAVLPNAGHPTEVSSSGRLASVVSPEKEKVVTVHANEVLANVNATKITLRDLIPLASNDYSNAEQAMPVWMYEALLNRAIERELAFQAAREQGVEMDAGQQGEVERVRQQILHRDDKRPDVLAHLNTGDVKDLAEFQARDAAGFLIQDALLAKAGVPSQFVNDEQVRRHYEQNPGKYRLLPDDPKLRAAAWLEIDKTIRQEISAQTIDNYQARRVQYLNQLKAAAYIKINPPGS